MGLDYGMDVSEGERREREGEEEEGESELTGEEGRRERVGEEAKNEEKEEERVYSVSLREICLYKHVHRYLYRGA